MQCPGVLLLSCNRRKACGALEWLEEQIVSAPLLLPAAHCIPASGQLLVPRCHWQREAHGQHPLPEDNQDWLPMTQEGIWNGEYLKELASAFCHKILKSFSWITDWSRWIRFFGSSSPSLRSLSTFAFSLMHQHFNQRKRMPPAPRWDTRADCTASSGHPRQLVSWYQQGVLRDGDHWQELQLADSRGIKI